MSPTTRITDGKPRVSDSHFLSDRDSLKGGGIMQHILRNTLTLLLGVFILVANGFAGNWHQWRGPDNDGVSQETDAPIQWSQTENVRVAFTAPR